MPKQDELTRLNSIQVEHASGEKNYARVATRKPLTESERGSGVSHGPQHPVIQGQQMAGHFQQETPDVTHNSAPEVENALAEKRLELNPGLQLQAQPTASATPLPTIPTLRR